MIKFKCPECGNPMNSLMHECLECGFPIECLQLEEDTNELQTKTAEIERLKDYIERNQLSFEQVEAQRKNLETEVIFLKTQLSKYEKIEDCKQKEKNRADISERRCKELELKIQQLEEKLEEVGYYKNVSEEQAIELKNEIQELEKAEAIINSDALNNISCENCGEKLTEDTACYDFAHQTEKKTHSKHKFLSKKNKYWLFLLLIVSVIIIFFSKSLSDKEESKQNIGIDLFDSEEKKINNLIEQFVLDLSTLMNMKGGETVYNADETKKILDGDGLEPIEVPQTVAKNPYAIDSLLSGQKLDLKSLVNRDIVLQRATPLDTYSMLEKYKDWVITDSLIMSRLNLPSQDFSKLGVVNNNQQQTVIQINGDLSFPNIKSGNDAELLLNDLSNMANKARQRSARR